MRVNHDNFTTVPMSISATDMKKSLSEGQYFSRPLVTESTLLCFVALVLDCGCHMYNKQLSPMETDWGVNFEEGLAKKTTQILPVVVPPSIDREDDSQSIAEEQKIYRKMTQGRHSVDIKHASPVINLSYEDENQQWSTDLKQLNPSSCKMESLSSSNPSTDKSF